MTETKYTILRDNRSWRPVRLLRLILLLLLIAGVQEAWAGVQFEAVNRMTDNEDGTFTSAWNAGNQYALALADFSNISGITTANIVKVEFDCTISSGDRWLIGLGDKTTRGTNANSSSKTNYTTDGLFMSFGSKNGSSYSVGETTNNSAFGQIIHVTFTFNRSERKYSYSIVNKNSPSTVYFSGNDIETTVTNLTLIEVYTWDNSKTITLSDVKVLDGFYFKTGTDVMYIEDLIYESPLVNETGETVTYTITGNDRNIRTEVNNNFPFYPIRTTGDDPTTFDNGAPIIVTATSGTTGKTSTLNLRVKTRKAISASSLVSGDAFNVGNSVGLITDESVNINGLIMHFGANSANNGTNKDEQQVVRNINGGYAVTCIDANGWTFGNITNFSDVSEYWGTFYRLYTDASPKDIVITGYFSGHGGLYNESGTKVFDIPSSAGALTLVRITHDQLSANTAYYLYCPMGLAALRSLAYTNFDVEFRYGIQDEAVAFKNETLAAPTFTVTNASGENVSSHYTMGGFSSSETSIATVVAGTGVVTTGSTQGKTVISCTLTSDDGSKSTYPDIPIVFNLYVTGGVWNLEEEVSYNGMDNSMTGLSDAQWSLRGGGHNRNKIYTNTDFEFIYDKTSNLYQPSYGLQIKGHSRFSSNDWNAGSTCNASIRLFAEGDNAALRIPARNGMLIEIKAYASDEETELTIEGVKKIDGTASNTYMTGRTSTTTQYICNTDVGYITLYNENSSLSVDIQKITASSEIVLRDGDKGEEIYVDKEQSYQNNILNAEGSGSTFSYSWVGDHTIANVEDDFTTTGRIRSFSGYGTATIRVTATGGLLNGKTKDFTIRPIKMSVIHSATYALLTKVGITGTISDDTGLGSNYYNYRNDLKQNIRVYKNNDSDVDATLLAQVVFTYESCTKPSTTATVTKSGDNYVFQADGLGDVVIKATLGTIERTFTYRIQGVEYETMNPVISSEESSYDLVVTNNGGTINSISVVSLFATYGNLTQTPTITKDGNTIKITNITQRSDWSNIDANIPSSKGGTYTIAATVNYTPEGGTAKDYTISTILTVAYSQNIWNFQGELSPYCISETMTDNNNNAYTDRPLPENQEDYYVARNTYWEYQKKFRSPDSNGGYVYAYRNIVNGNNAPIINETAGLQIYANGTMGVSSYATYTDNGYARTGTDKETYYEDAEGHKYSKTDTKRELVFKSGCRIVIPKLKPGQQIDLYWHRHHDDQGERLRMKNLCDASGEEITDIYKIAFTGMGHTDKQSTGAGSYSFIVKDTGEEYVDVEFSSVDGTWTRIHEIVLWEKPSSNYDDTQSTYKSTMENMDASRYLHVDNDESYTIDMNDAVWELNVHNGGNPTYTIKQDATLGATIDMSSGHPILHYNNGWGKFYVTLSNCTQDYKYISTWKNYTITVGKKPEQTYPYTWDFTKYRENTKSLLKDKDRVNQEIVVKVRDDKTKVVTRSTQTWNEELAHYTVRTADYGRSLYESYFVDNAQLVSSALNAPLPETEGLGFNLNRGNIGLTINMTNEVNNAEMVQQSGDKYQSWKVTTTGYLRLEAGGKVIVPKPSDETNYGDYYIYIHSSVKPTNDSHTEDVSNASGTDVNGGKHQYKYHFTANANAEFTFSSDVEIYAIGVTNILKQMTPLSGTAWATESRDHAIDYTLDSLLTINPVRAYAIIEQSGNPIYSDDKSKTTVAIKDQRYVVPANQGLVLKQIQKYKGSSEYVNIANDATPYSVPLFYPAITTAEDPAYRYANNLMRPNVTERTFTQERETATGEEDANGEFTRFILASKYMTWQKEGNNSASYDDHFTEGDKAAFYRMHIFGDEDYDQTTLTGTNRNTLGANKAYLVLRSDRINDPIWSTTAPARPYVAILGVSDFAEDTEGAATSDSKGSSKTYNMGGQAVDTDGALPPGIYIRNGKKMIVK